MKGEIIRFLNLNNMTAQFNNIARQLTSIALISVSLSLWPIQFAQSATSLENSLVIVTSFTEKFFDHFRNAFQKDHPSVKVHILNKKTSAAISYIQQRPLGSVDIFWASAPDAFEVLKQSKHLQKTGNLKRSAPNRLGGNPLDDPEGYYTGFAVSGYGIMWNENYLKKFGLPQPNRWDDLKKPVYHGHVGITAPSRSGTTHLIVETILQTQGWEKGWASLIGIGGNLATVTARSFGVRDGVVSGRFGVGLVIDFFGLSSVALKAPVGFIYTPESPLLPANIAMIKEAPHPNAAKAFINFLVSNEGQKILFDPFIRRLPVLRGVYNHAPEDYPNPFTQKLVDGELKYDRLLSRQRYHLVNVLFDRLITFRLKSLRETWRLLRQAETAAAESGSQELLDLAAQARKLISNVPVPESLSDDASFASVFKRRKPGLPLPNRQVELEEKWERSMRANFVEIAQLTRQVIEAATKIKGGTP